MEEKEKYRQLWASVIYKAVLDLKKKKYKDKAQAWIKSKDTYPQSFIWCCDIICIDPEKAKINIFKNLHKIKE